MYCRASATLWIRSSCLMETGRVVLKAGSRRLAKTAGDFSPPTGSGARSAPPEPHCALRFPRNTAFHQVAARDAPCVAETSAQAPAATPLPTIAALNPRPPRHIPRTMLTTIVTALMPASPPAVDADHALVPACPEI